MTYRMYYSPGSLICKRIMGFALSWCFRCGMPGMQNQKSLYEIRLIYETLVIRAGFYEIYTPSFFDANNDGKGDIPGIIQKLDYLVSMGIGAIWLTPFYRSPKVDNGYDISDYMSVDPEYGSTDDIIALIREAHKRNIKVVIDMVLNHTSDQHPWFLQSRLSKDNPKRNWYIWKDATGSSLPNNWESFFGGSAWEYDQKLTAIITMHFQSPRSI